MTSAPWRTRSSLSSAAPTRPKRNVDVSIQQGLRVTGDEQLLRIALVNLLANAFKFTLHTAPARVEISGRRDGENLCVQVRDNGAGFDPEHADRLFRPFQRLHAESEFAGIGIGLTTVQRVIRRHGGSITASGAIGHGASFACTLPAAEPAAANQAASTRTSRGESHRPPREHNAVAAVPSTHTAWS